MAKKKHKGGKKPKTNESITECMKCPSICCHDLAIEITRPRTKHEIENYSWYLHFDTVNICIRRRRWYLEIKGRCIYLDDNNMCTIYEDRPKKCREHNPPDCERYGKWYDVKLSTPEDLFKYLKLKKKKGKDGTIRYSKQP